jgi:hypothetical protein
MKVFINNPEVLGLIKNQRRRQRKPELRLKRERRSNKEEVEETEENEAVPEPEV